ncbi:MAG TPA: Xaa-Pro peptidase family protein [Syntrophorhabdaceae bacterium]|nr:Xaa-Pro peptidase family protein [Syntrophorhabdaceae bacterium]HOT41332.1 Xaa-Pro peptidase family protein [Syntrophorhabdaceae bacterium]HPC66690.1 Xaa-Pro peptidase family protein [Syntrophorhabdaceae bacterium]HQE79496.1 Xaa-Pro peptidase family protein [Syntrophorhabdaceae bacterium]HQH42211.1 Xaa-Pro peptidase family protein [Syntrophorhabdaceae bacterium]
MLFAPKEEIYSRITRLKSLMEDASLDGAFFHYKIDYYYLSGTMQDSLLFVPVDDEPVLFVKREVSRAKRESPINRIVSIRSIKEIIDHIKPIKKVGLQLDVVPYNDVMRFREIVGNVEFFNCSPLTRELRKVKSPFEIALIERAAAIQKMVYEYVPQVLEEGMTEIELGGILEAYAKALGHEGLLRVRSLNYEAYTWHIVSGRTGSIVSQSDSPMGGLGLSPAFPVGASMKKIKRNEPILIDFGICYHGYQADQTRMFAIGSMPKLFVDGYEACREIHYKVLDKVLEGLTSRELFEYSKKLADRLGFGDYYLGYRPHKVRFLAHGIGIELSELPFIAATHDYPINNHAVFAIEPKMVFPRKGACGIENTVYVDNGRYRILTDTDERITIL